MKRKKISIQYLLWVSLRYITFAILLVALPLAATPFFDNGDGTVNDGRTGLVWQKCSRGQNNDATCSATATTAAWADALTYCNGLTLAGKPAGSWRLPNVNEIKSISDRAITPNPAAIDNTIFPATVAGPYWSSSTYVPDTTLAWYVLFSGGVVSSIEKTASSYVRCVSQ